ncbi:ACT domain-containing protein [Erythrobacter sp. NFXS35]|uniref:ACT domain-containing protein n=1 Tax=Erythrobacter sp. NFXS35 TaxID=2818436 RepID=UPI0032DFEE9D
MPRQPVSELSAMLAGMAPVLHPDPWQFVLLDGDAPTDAFALIREDEGLTAIVAGQGDGAAFARITLMVHSALEGVGLTAAVSGALAGAGIACNIVAGFHHDHLFVPWARRDEALAVLQRLVHTD